MRIAIVLVPEAVSATGPDLTRYLLVCGGLVVGLLALAWAFKRFVARHVRSRASRRSLQVLDVLPLSGKQKLVVVRCYDRSFLLGLGEKEVRSIAELDSESVGRPGDEAGRPAAVESATVEPVPFGERLAQRLERAPVAPDDDEHETFVPPPPPRREQPVLGSKDGVLA